MIARGVIVLSVLIISCGCWQKTATPPGTGQQEQTTRDVKGTVKLTFDDGPTPGNTPVIFLRKDTPLDGNTPAVLDALRKYRVKATFFVVGKQARKYPDLVHREYSEGHSVQNHSYTHRNLTTLSHDQIVRELRATNRAITEADVPRPRAFRPPYGASDAKVKSVGASLNLSQIGWTGPAARDWEDPPAPVVCKRVVSTVHPGSIVLLHDGSGANTARALPCIIKELRAKGYKFGKL